jgi:phosphoribosylformylglycinamidine synthase PurS subunit|tara:strand:- start:60 stop:326 length:267 start_codon:yes stop_codon:yes gene_type:complete
LVGSSSLKWEVTSLLRDGIKGSEQEVIMKALIQLGFEEITEVLYGAVYNLTLDDKMSEDEQRLRINEMCSTNIINTNLYDFKIKLIEE